jgi:hypothetical protein
MICTDCTHKKHGACKARNAGKQGADCDCQHREIQKKKDETDGVAELGD